MRRPTSPLSFVLPFALAGALLAACDGSPTAVEYTDPEPEPTPARTDCVEDDFQGAPMQGPGFADGVYIGPTDSPLIASSTVLYLLDTPEAGARMQTLVQDVGAELMRSEGLLGVSLGGSAKCGSNRTLALWRDTESMMRFVGSDAHLRAIVATPEVADHGTRTVHWSFDPASETLDWATGIDMAAAAAPIGGLGGE